MCSSTAGLLSSWHVCMSIRRLITVELLSQVHILILFDDIHASMCIAMTFRSNVRTPLRNRESYLSYLMLPVLFLIRKPGCTADCAVRDVEDSVLQEIFLYKNSLTVLRKPAIYVSVCHTLYHAYAFACAALTTVVCFQPIALTCFCCLHRAAFMSNGVHLAVLLFPGYEPLDVVGPLELFGLTPRITKFTYVAETSGPVTSQVAKLTIVADTSFQELNPEDCNISIDWLFVPGGIGTRVQASNPALLKFIAGWAARAQQVLSVCTGAGLLAAAGVLDGLRATTNKRAFDWPVSKGPQVKWVRHARWVDDGKTITSSGVSAGMDMALYVIAKYFGNDEAEGVAKRAEYEWHRDAEWDPFSNQ